MSYLIILLILFFKKLAFIEKRRKVVIIGVGNVGSTAAYTWVNRGICEEVLMVDVNKDRVYGHAQDLFDAAAYRLNWLIVTKNSNYYFENAWLLIQKVFRIN